MFKRMFFSLLFWLGLANGLTALARMPLLGWFAQRRLDGLVGGLVAAWAARQVRPAWWMLPVAVPLQFGVASLRGIGRHPRQRLIPQVDPRCEAVQIGLGDRKIPGLLVRPAGLARAGVVVCHGAGAHKSYYTWRLIDALHAADLLVLAIDLDGHGDNQRRLEVPGVEVEIATSVAFLRQQTEQVGIVGISLGGCVAARAVADGLAVDALALVIAPLTLDLNSVPYLRRELLGLCRPAFWRSTDRATPLQLWREWGTAPIRAEFSTTRTIQLLNLAGALPHIACPTLLLYGTGDVIAPFQPVQTLLPLLRNGTLHLHPGPSHLSLTLESAPLEDLAAWLLGSLGK